MNVAAGWNLIGNPFVCKVYADQAFYKINEDRTGLSAELPVSTVIVPCEGIIVNAEAAGTMTFTRPSESSVAPNNGNLQISLAQISNERGAATIQDNAIVSFNEGSVLPKFRFGDNAEIYIPQNGEDYAIAYSNGQGEMPLNFKAMKDGNYTISVNPEGVEMNYLHLIDNMTGADVDLLQTAEYTFDAKTTDYESRFRLVFSANNEDGASTGSAAFAFFSNGEIIITDADACHASLQIIDVMGRIVYSGDAKHCVSTEGMTASVYVLRLINGNNVKTQKIVVR